MFRGKNRRLKSRRIALKRNHNKDSHVTVKECEGQNSSGYCKSLQHELKNQYDIKVDTISLRNLNYYNNLEYYREENPVIGNSNFNDTTHALAEIERDNALSFDSQLKHDITRWKSNKRKTKQRKREINDKMTTNSGDYTE